MRIGARLSQQWIYMHSIRRIQNHSHRRVARFNFSIFVIKCSFCSRSQFVFPVWFSVESILNRIHLNNNNNGKNKCYRSPFTICTRNMTNLLVRILWLISANGVFNFLFALKTHSAQEIIFWSFAWRATSKKKLITHCIKSNNIKWSPKNRALTL